MQIYRDTFFSVTNNDRDIQVACFTYLSLCVTNATLTLHAGKKKKKTGA